MLLKGYHMLKYLMCTICLIFYLSFKLLPVCALKNFSSWLCHCMTASRGSVEHGVGWTSWLNLGCMWVPFLRGPEGRRVFFFFGFFFPSKAKPFSPRVCILEGQKEIIVPGIPPKSYPFHILARWLSSSLMFQTIDLGRGEVRSASFVHFKTFLSLFMLYFLGGSR